MNILEPGEKSNAEVKEVKEQLEMKENTKQIDVRIEKEKKRLTKKCMEDEQKKMKTTHEETEEHLAENTKELKEKMECENFGGVGNTVQKSVNCAGLSGTSGESLPEGPTAMERLMRAVSKSLGQVALETARVLQMPPALQSSMQMQRVITPLQKELQPWVI
ncbi:uncharacterized protein MONOS_3096 [Monocercomonoides exilis]|uniref:uncharacterized protein n=1 Tax=Monocercomonoides exilis TaxID=2049356 RepID=UPI003559A6EA|nr:hypothetical protein MONOS_3096 [Monocercomonoides exilis]|eukprot:MONOS_3096.1-p1 / transcript=MONOS_3096.1 / gene=MONOS_3096 / organism=Monocercomonoides_exilis_PA203 / gene_product=unspecified product / transcript_product=unspecified product / location=Mono_scaffold00069:119326-120311(-) / protein_length=162 / sequence_SO=supercontig / SO=protein_coding / is_pseudo=false